MAVAVAMVALFGLTSMSSLPNIIEPQESVLRNTPGLTDINSFIGRGQGFVNLSFAVGTDMQTAKLDVINKLAQAPPRPN